MKKKKAEQIVNAKADYVSYVKSPASGFKFKIIKSQDKLEEILKSKEGIESEENTDLSVSIGQKIIKTIKGIFSEKTNAEKEFIKEVGDMSIAEELLKSIKSMNEKLDTIEKSVKNDTADEKVAELTKKQEELQSVLTIVKNNGGTEKETEFLTKQIDEVKTEIETLQKGETVEANDTETSDPKGDDEVKKEEPEAPAEEGLEKSTEKEMLEMLKSINSRIEKLEKTKKPSNQIVIDEDEATALIKSQQVAEDSPEFWKGII